MDQTNTAREEAAASLIPMAQEALADTPMYIDHISNTFSICADSLRAGNDREGMYAFARGASDLDQFIQLFHQVKSISKPSTVQSIDTFNNDLTECIRGLEVALTEQDMVALSDGIEGNLLSILPRWESVAEELNAGFQNQGV